MISNDKKIAIIGMSCRLPGKIQTPNDYWNVLSNGQDVVTEVDQSRWATDFLSHPNKNEPGKSYTFAAGVLNDIESFDASFFGISPREADQMDPQQRLLLELSWEAIENSGVTIDKITKTECAVYVGIASNDYAHRHSDDLASFDAYTMTGSTASVASNRISYAFDLRGPSVSVDTACSSSLVAVHQACQVIRTGEATTALCGGINMLIHPFPFVGFAKASMLSPDGRCKAFDDSGNGYVRSEGAGMLLLKPLDQAEADGDFIHAVIASSGVNCDGNTSGITVPGMETQSALLNRVYSNCGISANDLSYIEAHGTGTAVGDPLEATALGETIGKKRSLDKPLLIGSAKTNLGHLETASGMAGLLKAVLTLKHKSIPASLHFKTPNKNIDFEGLNLSVVTENTPLQTQEKPHYIGINSFGFGGANAHVLLEEYKVPSTESPSEVNTSLPPLFISAKNTNALPQHAQAYADLLKSEPSDYYHIAYSTRFKRTKLPQVLAIKGETSTDAINILEAYANGEKSPYAVSGSFIENAKLAFVFTGNGCQWQGMGQSLHGSSAIFRNTFDEVSRTLAQLSDKYSLEEELFHDDKHSNLEKTEIAQPLLFGIQVAVVRYLESYGIKPSAVLGHSVGEVAAAWASGALSLEQASLVIHHRSQAQGLTKGCGRMAAVGIAGDSLAELLESLALSSLIEVAGENSPSSSTVASDLESLEVLESALKEKELFYHLLDLDYAFHSTKMDSVKDEITSSLSKLTPSTSTIKFISSVMGGELSGEKLTADYWWKNIRQPVQFAQGIKYLIQDGTNVFVEVGPHSILRGYINECLSSEAAQGVVLETLKRKQDSLTRLDQNALKILMTGCSSDESLLFPHTGKHVDLPHYPWQREYHWYNQTTEAYNLAKREREHPLLGYRLKDSDIIWENNLDTAEMPYLADHVVDDATVLPAAAYIEMAIAASHFWAKTNTHHIEMVEIPSPILFEADNSKKIRFHLDPSDGSFRICSRDRLSNDDWTENARGRLLGRSYKKARKTSLLSNEIDQKTVISALRHYELASEVGLDYGPHFQAVTTVSSGVNKAIASLELPGELEDGIESYHLHPSLLDSGFQVLVDICKQAIESGHREALIPIQIGSLHLFESRLNHTTQIRVDVIRQSPRSMVANFSLYDENGTLLAELERCRFRQIQFKKALRTKINQYKYTCKPLPLIQQWPASPEIDLSRVLQFMQSRIEKQSDSDTNSGVNENSLLIDMMVTSYAYQAIEKLAGNKELNVNSLKEEVSEKHHDLLKRLLDILRENDLLVDSEKNNNQILLPSDELPETIQIWQHIIRDSPDYLPELVLLSRCGEHLASLLTGEIDSEQLLEPEKSSLLQQLNEVGPSYKAFNNVLLSAISEVIEQFPSDQLCRILVVANYPEQITTHLLETLNNHTFELIVTSSDETRLRTVDRILENSGCGSTVAIELNKLKKDTFSEPFDFIVCPYTLHLLDDLKTGLNTLRHLLNSNGLLLGLERADDRFSDFVFGTNADWWNEHRSRLSRPHEWSAVLNDVGFTDISTVSDNCNPSSDSAFVLIAKNASSYQPITEEQVIHSKDKVIVISRGNKEEASILSKQLYQNGAESCVFLLDSGLLTNEIEEYASQESCLNLVLQEGGFKRIVFLSSWNDSTLARPLYDLKDLLAALENISEKPQLNIVSRGAVVVEKSNFEIFTNPQASPLWGFGRVVMNEYPELECRLIDIQDNSISDTLSSLLIELLSHDENDEVIITPSTRHVLRMEQSNKAFETRVTAAPAALNFKVPGSFNNLYWKPLPEVNLAADQIEIQPVASGLNFRDIMYAMGLLSDEAVENGFAGPSLGMETAGIVTKVGEDVTEFSVGDEVFGFAPACFSNRVITETTATAHKPAHWSYEEAATIPAAFFTVYYAFVELAKVEEGEKVLIHGGSGGVGIAAIQLALHLGLEVFATAGTDEKRTFVRSMGAHHVMNSRNLSFETEIMEITEGKGIDIVLNSVSGEAINRNLSVLKPFGRFLELGKRDFYENSRIGLRPFRNNVTYFGIDADQLLIEKKPLARRLFKNLMSLFESGALHPLPYRVFESGRIQDAFQYMQQSRQIGKIIINIPPELPTESAVKTLDLVLEPKKNYLVSGGLGGFGLATAKWLIEKGAKHLTLLGRKGLVTEEAKLAVAKMEDAGAQVYCPACDVSKEEQLRQVFDGLSRTAPEIAGVIHAATLFDDSLIRNLSRDQIDNVINAKALGAWNLHKITKNMPLDFFVMYSSATSLFGNPGQANYVAANYMLENLVAHRRQLGMKACYAAWGAISDTGFLSRNDDTKDGLLSRLGGTALTSEEALNELEQLIGKGESGAAFINFNWKSIKKGMPSAKSPKFEQQNNELSKHGGSDEIVDFMTRIVGLPDNEVQKLIAEQLTQEISEILRLPIEKVDQNCAISDLGMDSLMGMELLLAIEEQFGTKLPLMSLTEGGSIQKISDKIRIKLRDTAQPESDETVVNLVSKHGANISNDDLERLKQVNNE